MHKMYYALQIAKEQSLSKAAEKLYLTPSALSQCITKEEERLGVQLFVRSRENWLPTYAGMVYIETAKKLLEMQENMERELSDIAGCKTGRFTVGVTPSRGAAMFVDVFPVFNETYPDVKVHLREANWKRLQRLLLENALDIAFTCTSDPAHDIAPGLETEVLAEEDFVLLVPRNHPAAKLYEHAPADSPVVIDLSLFKNDRFISLSRDTTIYHTTKELFDMAGISPEIIFESSSTTTVQNLALQGFGIAILPSFFARESEKSVYFKLYPSISWSIMAVWRKGYRKTKAIQHFIHLAKGSFHGF